MRVGFFGQTGPYAPPVLRYLAAGAPGVELALVVEGKKARPGRLEHRLRKPLPGPLPQGNELGELGRALGCPVLETCDVNAPTAVQTLVEHELDCIVCVGFDRLFSPAVLAAASRLRLNAHPSLLPSWRGPSPLFWILRSGERSFGVTIHGLDAREDHGPVYAQAAFAAPHCATGDELYALAAAAAGPLLAGVLARARAGTVGGTPQDHARATRAPRPTPEDALVVPGDWDCSTLVDFCCGAPFFRTPWLRFGEEVFFVRRGIAADPGRTMPVEYALAGTTLVVRCRDGLARLEVQV